MPDMKSTRDGYGDALVEIGKDNGVVALDADLAESTRSIKFKEKYPEIFANLKITLSEMDYWEIFEIIPKEDSIEEITIETESVILILLDGSEQKILNTELITVFGTNYYEGCSIFSDKQYVYFILSIAYFQKGAIAIWDINEKNWIFSYSDECFCVESIVYSKTNKIFIGISIWNYPIINNSGEYFFVIKPDRSFLQVELEKMLDSNLDLTAEKLCQPYINFNNYSLFYDEKKSIVIKKEEDTLSFYHFNPQIYK